MLLWAKCCARALRSTTKSAAAYYSVRAAPRERAATCVLGREGARPAFSRRRGKRARGARAFCACVANCCAHMHGQQLKQPAAATSRSARVLVACRRFRVRGAPRPASRSVPQGAMAAAFGGVGSLPIAVMTDSYKACHPLMYPDATKMVAVRRWLRLRCACAPANAALARATVRRVQKGVRQRRARHARRGFRHPLHRGDILAAAVDPRRRRSRRLLLQVRARTRGGECASCQVSVVRVTDRVAHPSSRGACPRA
jgi:hypothetical protein